MRRKTPLTGRALFRAVAPRLELAHRQRTEIRTQLRRDRNVQADILHDAEWRVEHRELQLLRSRTKKYGDGRQRKLEEAREKRDQAVARLHDANERLRAA